MSKIGKISISIPEKVKVVLAGNIINIEGPLGKKSLDIDLEMFNLDIKEGKEISIKPKKIDQTTELEKKELSKWLNKSEDDLKSFYGQPDKVEFLKTRNRNYIYFTEKYKIKCERKFEVNPKNIAKLRTKLIGATSVFNFLYLIHKLSSFYLYLSHLTDTLQQTWIFYINVIFISYFSFRHYLYLIRLINKHRGK